MNVLYHKMIHGFNGRACVAAAALAIVFAAGSARAQMPPDPDRFCACLYADELMLNGCVSGPAGSAFDLFLFLWVPAGPGLKYVTLRFDFPEVLGLSGRPHLHALATDLIVVDFIDGTVEWTVLFRQCPGEWVEVFRQECILLGEDLSPVRIVEANSLARDCDFVLDGLIVMNAFLLNDPSCPFVGTDDSSWGAIKGLCR